jgi:hypothetical protein
MVLDRHRQTEMTASGYRPSAARRPAQLAGDLDLVLERVVQCDRKTSLDPATA